MNAFIHPLADVKTPSIGEGTSIWQFCVVLPKAIIGSNCNICSHCFIENNVIVGNNVTIKNGVQLWDGLRVGNNVFIGPNVTFTNDNDPHSKQYPKNFPETILEEGVSIGANATILPGLTLRAYALIGAGSLVTKNVPPYTVWFGNPAKFQRYISQHEKYIQ